MLPLSPDCHALRATIALIDHLGLASLVGCLPLPLFHRRTTARAFSGYRTVFGTRSLYITSVIAVLVFTNSARVLFSLGCRLRILPMSSAVVVRVLCRCSVLPIDTRYQVSGRCSILLIILAVSRWLLAVLRIECDHARTVRVLFSQ